MPEYTTDADVVIDPALLRALPELEQSLTSAGGFRGPRVGAWAITKQLGGQPVDVEIDLMVPEAVGGSGRRAARLSGHKDQLARKARGLEATLIDKSTFVVGAMGPADARSYSIAVAGPAALLVSKVHKIGERLAEGKVHRLDDKDALDVLRLLQAVPTGVLAGAFLALVDDAIAKVVTVEALASLKTQFATSTGGGSQWLRARPVRSLPRTRSRRRVRP